VVERRYSRVEASRADIVEALRECVSKNHRLLHELHFERVETLEAVIGRLDEEVGEQPQTSLREDIRRPMATSGACDYRPSLAWKVSMRASSSRPGDQGEPCCCT
jgi:hypothetical protein